MPTVGPIVSSGGIAYVGLDSQELVALALGDGTVLWRHPNSGRPIAASASHLLALGRRGYELLSAESGEFIAGLGEAGIPHPEDLVEVRVEETPEGPTIAWTNLPRYRGGAFPPLTRASPTPKSDAVVVDVASGVAKPVSAPLPEGSPVEVSVVLSLSDSTLVLEARDPAGVTRWATPLGGAPKSRPTPLPQ